MSRVVWSEGMYLSPQHFQAQSRFYDETLGFVRASLWSAPWGLLYARMDEDALRNGRLVLLEAAGIFEDGLAFESDGQGAAALPRRAEELLAPTEASAVVYLGVPPRTASGQAYAPASANDGKPATSFRFRTVAHLLRDDTNGTDEREVPLGQCNLMVLGESELADGISALPLARMARDGRGGLVYDPEFMPAMLRVSSSPALMLMTKRLLESLTEKIASLSPARKTRGRWEAGTGALDVASYWFLHALSSAAPVLRHLYATRHCHPEQLFGELSRLAGALCTFATETLPESLPEYDHRDPGAGFRALDAHIRRHLELVIPSNTVSLQFAAAAPFIQEAEVADERCLRRARWILGIRANLGEADLLLSVPRLIKICSARFVPELVRRALPGLTLLHLPVPPAAIRAEADKQYFSLDLSGPCWEHILQTRRVGVYIPGEISEPDFDLTVIVEPAP